MTTTKPKITPMEKQPIILNMIVKNEAQIITRCLSSFGKIATHYCIVDTGSTDDTISIIRNYFSKHKLQGVVYEREWVNFSHNRNEALELAREYAGERLSEAYLLLADADEEFTCEQSFRLPTPLTAWRYNSEIVHGVRMVRTRLVKADAPFSWWYPRHEALCCEGENEPPAGFLEKCLVKSYTDGDRAKDPSRWLKDAEVLAEAITIREKGELYEGKPLELSRLYYYCANSYYWGGDYNKAEGYYQKRIALEDFPEERFHACYMLAKMKRDRDDPYAEVVGTFLQAYSLRPTRYEPIYHLLVYLINRGDYATARLFAEPMSKATIPSDVLFIEEGSYKEGKRIAQELMNPSSEQLLNFALVHYLKKQWVELIGVLQRVNPKRLQGRDKFTYYDLSFIGYSWLGQRELALKTLYKLCTVIPVKEWKDDVLRLIGYYHEHLSEPLEHLPREVRAQYLTQKKALEKEKEKEQALETPSEGKSSTQ